MKIQYVKGDLLLTPHRLILHGCNARGAMGSGVAKLIRSKYSKAFEDYFETYNGYGLNLGTCIFSDQSDGKVIINAITQETYGKNGVHVSYWAIANVMRNLNRFNEPIAMPMIGAGLGGGDWNVISAIIENEAKTYQPVVYLL
jgi:O-acetyl-ADP-ribose deacetylase (regulator of RNase III)